MDNPSKIDNPSKGALSHILQDLGDYSRAPTYKQKLFFLLFTK